MAFIAGRTWLELLSLRCHARTSISAQRFYSSTSIPSQDVDSSIVSQEDVEKSQERPKRRTPSAEDLILDAEETRARRSAKSKNSGAAPVMADLLMLRPRRYEELNPPRKTTHEERLDWYAKRFAKSVKSVAGAFTKQQLRALVDLMDPDSKKPPYKKVDKPTLAKELVEDRRGWNWENPERLYKIHEQAQEARLAKEREFNTSRVGVPLVHKEIKMLAREVYLCASTVQQLASRSDLTYTIRPPNREDLNQVTVELTGTKEQVQEAADALAQMQESIQETVYKFPTGASVDSSVITNIALFTKTYIEPAPETSNLVLWSMYRKGNKAGLPKFHLDRAAVEGSTSRLRQMYHKINQVASLEGYAYLPFNTGGALPLLAPTGENGLLTRFSLVRELEPWDIETIDQGTRDMMAMDVRTRTAQFIPDLKRNLEELLQDGEVHITMRFGHLVFPAATELMIPTFYASRLDTALLKVETPPYFLPSCPPAFLSFLQPESEKMEQGEYVVAEQYQERMASCTVDSSETRIVTYRTLTGDQKKVTALVGSQKQKVKDEPWTFKVNEGVEMGLFLPDKNNDLTASLHTSKPVEGSRIEGDPFTELIAGSAHAPQYLTFDNTEYILVSDIHERRTHIRDAATALDMMSLPGAQEKAVKWDLVTRYDRLEQGKRSTCLELCGTPSVDQLPNLYRVARKVI